MRGERLLQRYEEKKEEVRKVVEQDGVALAYLFGSGARRDIGPLSDLDFAVYLDDTETYVKILGELNEILGDDIDLVLMNDADALLNFNVIKGECIYARSEDERVMTEARIIQRNLDEKYYRDRHLNETISRIAERGLV